MILAGLVLARFVHFTCLAILFGAAWSPAYAETDSIRRPLGRVQHWAIGGAILSALAWFTLTVASMADAPASALDPATLWMTVSATDFGRLWAARLAGLAVLWGFLGWSRQGPRLIAVGLSGLLLASLGLTGHAQAEMGGLRLFHASADALHLLAAGLWLGGLVVLGILLRSDKRVHDVGAREALQRFSGTGMVAVAVLVGTGLVNSYLLVRTPMALVTTTYGKLLSVKLVLFAVMVALAALNRGAARSAKQPLAGFRRRVIIEQALGVGVLACVAVLGVIAPAADPGV